MYKNNIITKTPLGKIHQWMIKPMYERFLGNRIYTQSQSITTQIAYWLQSKKQFSKKKTEQKQKTNPHITSKNRGIQRILSQSSDQTAPPIMEQITCLWYDAIWSIQYQLGNILVKNVEA